MILETIHGLAGNTLSNQNANPQDGQVIASPGTEALQIGHAFSDDSSATSSLISSTATSASSGVDSDSASDESSVSS